MWLQDRLEGSFRAGRGVPASYEDGDWDVEHAGRNSFSLDGPCDIGKS